MRQRNKIIQQTFEIHHIQSNRRLDDEDKRIALQTKNYLIHLIRLQVPNEMPFYIWTFLYNQFIRAFLP